MMHGFVEIVQSIGSTVMVILFLCVVFMGAKKLFDDFFDNDGNS